MAQVATLITGLARPTHQPDAVPDALPPKEDDHSRRNVWQDMVHQMSGPLGHAAPPAPRAETPALARERDQPIVAAVAAVKSREPGSQVPASQKVAELLLNEAGAHRPRAASPPARGTSRSVRRRLVQHAVIGMPGLVPGRVRHGRHASVPDASGLGTRSGLNPRRANCSVALPANAEVWTTGSSCGSRLQGAAFRTRIGETLPALPALPEPARPFFQSRPRTQRGSDRLLRARRLFVARDPGCIVLS